MIETKFSSQTKNDHTAFTHHLGESINGFARSDARGLYRLAQYIEPLLLRLVLDRIRDSGADFFTLFEALG